MRKHRKCYSKRGVSRNHLPCLEMPILVVKSHKKVKETITAVWSYWRAEDKEVIIWIPAYEIGGSSRVLATFCSHLLIFFPCKYLTFHFTVSKLSNNDKAESHSPKPKVWTKALFRSNFFMLITRPWKAGRLGRLPICSVPRWHLWLRGVAVLYLGTEAWRHHTKQKFCWYCHASADAKFEFYQLWKQRSISSTSHSKAYSNPSVAKSNYTLPNNHFLGVCVLKLTVSMENIYTIVHRILTHTKIFIKSGNE